MGGGVSSLPYMLDSATVQQIAGSEWDETKFVELSGSKDASITREQFLAAVESRCKDEEGKTLSPKSQPGAAVATDDASAIQKEKTTSWKKTPPTPVRSCEKLNVDSSNAAHGSATGILTSESAPTVGSTLQPSVAIDVDNSRTGNHGGTSANAPTRSEDTAAAPQPTAAPTLAATKKSKASSEKPTERRLGSRSTSKLVSQSGAEALLASMAARPRKSSVGADSTPHTLQRLLGAAGGVGSPKPTSRSPSRSVLSRLGAAAASPKPTSCSPSSSVLSRLAAAAASPNPASRSPSSSVLDRLGAAARSLQPARSNQASPSNGVLSRLGAAAAVDTAPTTQNAERTDRAPLNCLAEGESSEDFFKNMERNLKQKTTSPLNCLAEGESSEDFFKNMERNLKQKTTSPLNCLAEGESSEDFFKNMERNLKKKTTTEHQSKRQTSTSTNGMLARLSKAAGGHAARPAVNEDSAPVNCLGAGETSQDFFRSMEEKIQQKLRP